ncbi:hypothetical protein IF2G_01100 [Cordyceps javanica]|nr:hypothetical protein IF2G_01100 [Cordyceps javanica]
MRDGFCPRMRPALPPSVGCVAVPLLMAHRLVLVAKGSCQSCTTTAFHDHAVRQSLLYAIPGPLLTFLCGRSRLWNHSGGLHAIQGHDAVRCELRCTCSFLYNRGVKVQLVTLWDALKLKLPGI